MQTPNSISDAQANAAAPILFFDGVCGLCDWFVTQVLTHDRTQIMRVAPFQGRTAAAVLPSDVRNEAIHTVIYWRKGEILRRSRAIAWVLHDMGGVWRGLGMLLRCIPPFIADWAYNGVARSRYRLFGRHDQCRLPTPDERTRFLD